MQIYKYGPDDDDKDDDRDDDDIDWSELNEWLESVT
jgi:hypothetical protein